MRYYIDTEFIEDGPEHPLRPISIGIVSEDGREFYAVLSDTWDPAQANGWVRENVLPFLENGPRRTREQVRQEILRFLGEDARPEFWADYGAYDWVVFCQLFGTMCDLPKGWPMFVMDFQQRLRAHYAATGYPGDHILPRLPVRTPHNALQDALELQYQMRWLEGQQCQPANP